MKRRLFVFLNVGLALAMVVCAQSSSANSLRLRELTERRSSHASHWLMSDGRVQAQISTRPVFYQDPQGNWRPISTRLTASTLPGFTYEATQNEAQVYLPAQASGFHRVSAGAGAEQRWVDFRPLDLTGVAVLRPSGTGTTVTDAGPNVDLRYEVLAQGGLKEEILLKSPQAARQFRFEIRMHRLALRQQSEAGEYVLVPNDPGTLPAHEGAPVFTLPEAFAVDSAGRWTTDIRTDVVTNGDTAILTLEVPQDWLAAATFPVILDPTVMVMPDASTGKDTWQSDCDPDNNYGSDTFLWIGTLDSPCLDQTAFIQFPLGSIPKGSTISDADVALYLYQAGGGTTHTMAGYASAVPWDENTLNRYTRPSRGTSLGSMSATSDNTEFSEWKYSTTGLTQEVAKWFNGEEPNFGLELAITGGTWMKVYASDAGYGYAPALFVTYSGVGSPHNKAYTGYPKAWEAGEAINPWQVVNLTYDSANSRVNGNVLTAVPITGWNSRGFPVSFTVYHNSLDPDSGTLGLGWTHTYAQTLTPSGNNLIYKAGDGTRITFTGGSTSGPWDGPAGVPARITYGYNSSTGKDEYTLYGADHSTLVFTQLTNGPIGLVRLRDPLDKNGVDLTYDDTSNRLIYITEILAVPTGYSPRRISISYYSSGKIEYVRAPPAYSNLDLNWVFKYSGDKLTEVWNPIDAANNSYRFVFAYNSDGVITKIGDPDNNNTASSTRTYLYQLDYGKYLQLIGVRGRNLPGQIDTYEKWFTASSANKTVTVTDVHNNKSQITFDTSNRISSTTDASAKMTNFQWDGQFNLTGIRLPDDQVRGTSFWTYQATYYSGATNPLNRSNVFTSTANLRYGALSETHTTTYTYSGNVNTDTFNPDRRNSVVQIKEPVALSTFRYHNFVYDEDYASPGSRNTLYWKLLTRAYVPRKTDTFTATDAHAMLTYDSEGFGLLTQIQSPRGAGYTTKYFYGGDWSGAMANADGLVDPYYNLVMVENPLTRTWKFSYNQLGGVTRRDDPKGQTTAYDYNQSGQYSSDGRLKAVIYPTSPSLFHRWTPNGQIRAANGIDNNSNYDFLYTDGGLLRTNRQTRLNSGLTVVDYTYNFSYDGVGRTKEMKRSSSIFQKYAYTSRDQLYQASKGDGTQPATYTYSDNGLPLVETYANGNRIEREYDNLGQLRKVTYLKRTSVGPPATYAVEKSYEYTYNYLGQIEKVTLQNSTTVTYEYYTDTNYADARLRKESRSDLPNGYRYYTYDLAGNRTLKIAQTGPSEYKKVVYVYDLANQLDYYNTWTGCDQSGNNCASGPTPTDLSYDLNGNREVTGFTYDEENRATDTNFGAIKWDGYGQRIEIGSNQFEYGGGERSVAKDSANTILEYFRSGLGPVNVERTSSYPGTGAGLYWYQPDGQGANRRLTDGSQAEAWHRCDDAYGVLVSNGGTVTNEYDYGGAFGYERRGNYLLLGVRVYDPETGTFLQQDPLSIGLGDYTYAGGDPVNNVDPDGREVVNHRSVPILVLGSDQRGIERLITLRPGQSSSDYLGHFRIVGGRKLGDTDAIYPYPGTTIAGIGGAGNWLKITDNIVAHVYDHQAKLYGRTLTLPNQASSAALQAIRGGVNKDDWHFALSIVLHRISTTQRRR